MENIEIGDVVRFKCCESDENTYVVYDFFVPANAENTKLANVINITKDYSTDKVWRFPIGCFTKIPSNKITYIEDTDRGTDTIMPGDIVSFKNKPEIKMVVKELSMNGNEVTVAFFNPTKEKIEEISNIPKPCFKIYEMIVAK